MKSRPQSWREISAAPRLFIAVVVLCGTTILTYSLWHGRSENPLKFFCYLVIALAASRLKVNLPGITGTMSVNFLFLLLGVLELSLPETMALACAAVVVQCLDNERPNPIQVTFNVCSTALAIAVTFSAYRFFLRQSAVHNPSTCLLYTSGNQILDCSFGRIEDPAALARVLSDTPGIVEHGLFIGLAKLALVGKGDAVEELRA